MKYYIAADGGGTKLQVILYDEDLHIINTAQTYGTNTNFKPIDQIEKDIRKLLKELLPDTIAEIDGVDLSILGSADMFLNILGERCKVKRYSVHNEGCTALAATGAQYGIVAQAGTGSDTFYIQRDIQDFIGGWGPMLGDEGSGYDIGLRTLKAAIYACDGRGPRTVLLDLIKEEWELENLSEIIKKLVNAQDYRRVVGAVTQITARAAKHGDTVALKIYEHAANEMVLQVNTIIERYKNWEGPIVASGGAWKGCRLMFETFSRKILDAHPDAMVKRPVFEPVVGCVILRCFENGLHFKDIETTLRNEFRQFLIDAN